MIETPALARAIALCASYAVALAACVSPAAGARSTAVLPLPVSVQGVSLSLRAESRSLTPDSANLVIHVVPRVAIARLRIDLSSLRAGLRISPAACVIGPLSPPAAAHASGPPYPLPVVRLCSFVLSAPRSAEYPLRIRVRDATGRDLIRPIRTSVVLQGGFR